VGFDSKPVCDIGRVPLRVPEQSPDGAGDRTSIEILRVSIEGLVAQNAALAVERATLAARTRRCAVRTLRCWHGWRS
jgi:hypothetical protein